METHVKRSIRHCLEMIAPFEASERQKEEGQLQFYRFMVSIYEGMYENPEEYLVFPAPYEEYISKREQRQAGAAKEKEHTSDPKESMLRNAFQQAIQFYTSYFLCLGSKCIGLDESSGALVIEKEKYLDVLEEMRDIYESKYNEGRYEVLAKLGIQNEERGNKIYIVHKECRRAMEGLLYLAKAPYGRYRRMNFYRLDYKNAYLESPTVEDICKTLPEESSQIVQKLEEAIAGMKIKTKIKPLRGIVSDFKWKVEYIYKKKNVCGFYADRDYFMLCIHFNHFQNITDFATALQEENEDLFQWFKKQFPERLCSCQSNRKVYFGDEPRRICGLSNRAEIVSPCEEDVENALYVLKKYRNI